MIDYRERQPRRSLRPYIESLWTLRGRANAGDPTNRILPDGCMEVVLNFADRFTRHHDCGREELQPAFMLVGQMTHWIDVSAGREIDLIGIRFKPGGAIPFFGFDASDCTGQTLDAAALCPAIRDAAERTADVRSPTGRLATLETALEAMCAAPPVEIDRLVSVAVKRILDHGGNIPVRRVASNLGVHERSLERRFRRHVGISPKMLARITRFQNVFRAVNSGDAGWASIAAHCGYYDQSHLLRDFREFAGDSPAVLTSREIPMTRAFLRANRVSDSSNTDA